MSERGEGSSVFHVSSAPGSSVLDSRAALAALDADHAEKRRHAELAAVAAATSRRREVEAGASRGEFPDLERADRELRIRLDADQRARAEAHDRELAHRERLARIALGDRRRRVGLGTFGFVMALAAGGIVAIGILLNREFQQQIEAARGPAPAVDAPDLEALTHAAARVTLEDARTEPPAPVAVPPAPELRPRATRASAGHAVRRAREDLGRMLDGPDLVTAAGRIDDGAAGSPRRRSQ